MLNIFLYGILILFDDDPKFNCLNTISLRSKKEDSGKLKFVVDVRSETKFTYILYEDHEGILKEIKRAIDEGRREIIFTEKKLIDGNYRIVFEFDGETTIVCKRKSLEIL